MKKNLLPRRRHEYTVNNILTTFDYILEEDINNYDTDWIKEWDLLKHRIHTITIDGKSGYYYSDYKNIALSINYYRA